MRVLDPELGVGDRDAHRARLAREILRRQVRAALALGEAVHREDLRAAGRCGGASRGAPRGSAAAVLVTKRTRARSCAIVLHLQEDREHRRHAREDRHALALHRLEHRRRGRRSRPRGPRVRPDARRHQHLVEPVVEGERQGVEDHVVLAQAEVRGDARGRGEHVGVGEHHALGLAGAARGVDDRGEILIDARAARRAPRPRARAPRPSDRTKPPGRRGGSPP